MSPNLPEKLNDKVKDLLAAAREYLFDALNATSVSARYECERDAGRAFHKAIRAMRDQRPLERRVVNRLRPQDRLQKLLGEGWREVGPVARNELNRAFDLLNMPHDNSTYVVELNWWEYKPSGSKQKLKYLVPGWLYLAVERASVQEIADLIKARGSKRKALLFTYAAKYQG